MDGIEPLKEIDAAIAGYEERLRAAMLASDVATLELLLADDLTFINHLGGKMSKTEDLEAHRSGALRLSRVDYSDLSIRPLKDAAVVTLQAHLEGSYQGAKFAGSFAYSRMWQISADGWKVVSAHCSAVFPEKAQVDGNKV